MAQPISFDDGSGLVCKLNKSFYSLKQSNRLQNGELNKVLLIYDLKRSEVGQSAYYCKDRDKILNNESTKFKMKGLAEAISALGTPLIAIDKITKPIKINQSQFLTDILTRFGKVQY